MSGVDSELSNSNNHDGHSSVNTIHETETPPGISSSNNHLTPEAQNESVKGNPKVQKTCFWFQKAGNCRFGSSCKFKHDESSIKNPSKSSDSQSQSVKSEKPNKICFSFAKSGTCRFGEKCKFVHEVKKREESVSCLGKERDSATRSNTGQEFTNKSSEKTTKSKLAKATTRPKVCRYYKQGSCRSGDTCKFLHPEKKQDETKGEEPPIPGGSEKMPTPRPKVQLPTLLSLSELTDGDQKQLRETEIEQLKKRFPNLLEMENEGQPSIYRIIVQPTDPDWPYDLRDFQFNVSFPFAYPVEPPVLSLPEDQDIPAVVLGHMTASVQEWILAKHEMNKMSGQVVLIFRPFLRWLDRNLEKQFTEGARKFKREVDIEKSGFEFVCNVKDVTEEAELPQPSLPEDAIIISKPRSQRLADDDESDEEMLPPVTSEVRGKSDDEEGTKESSDEEKESSKNVIITYDPPDKNMRGTEVIFQGLELSESVATLAVVNLTVIVQCTRCKTNVDVTTPPRRNNLITCEKCNNRQILTYRPCLVHPFSHVIGFLDLDGSLPFDVNLVTSTLTVGCLSCSHENKLKGIQYGQIRNLWCENCHQKMTIQMQSCRFQKLQPAENIGSGPLHTVQVKGPKKQQKDPAIVDMLPLPENGCCRHYKKSFRWLRFPCCGKFFPCDECHDLDNNDGHEMKYATRMLCGFCAKEQIYSVDKPCVRCGSSTTKGRTQHWEGGTGCRNKIKMSRTDKQKYVGKSKTLSKKAYKKAAEPVKKAK